MSDARPHATPSRRAIRLIGGLIALSLLVPALGISIVAWQDHEAVIKNAEQHVDQTVGILQEHVLKVLETDELLLDKIVMRIDELPPAEIKHSETLSPVLAQLLSARNQIATVSVLDSDGVVRAVIGPLRHAVGLDLSDRDYFRALRDSSIRSFISDPHFSEVAKERAFSITQRLSAGAGHFDGVVHIDIPVESIERFFQNLEPRQRHRIVLVRADGAVLASDPPPPQEVEHFPANALLMRAINSGFQMQEWRRSPVDGTEHFFAWRQLGAYPIYIAYAIDRDVALQPWYEHLRLYGAIVAGAALSLFLVSLLALRHAQRELTLAREVAEEAQRRAEAEASLLQARKMEAVGQLTGGVAHDFNSLLTTILGNVERAQQVADRSKQAHCLRQIEHAANHGARLVHHLLAFARRQHLDPQPIDLNQIVRQLVGLLENTIGAHIQIDTELTWDLWPAMGDPSQIETAILNLALNARDAMPSGGHLTIGTVNLAADDAERPHELAPGDYVSIFVRDTGSGMSKTVQAKAFEPFFTTKAFGKGSGLGLSQVYGMARQSGGTVTITSRPDVGTCVRVYFPRARQSPVANAAEDGEDTAPAAPPGATILVVDDDEQVRSFVADSLSEEGYHVFDAADADAALDTLRAHAVDAAVIDLAMPGMEGPELARQARLHRRDLPIVFITAHVDPDLAEAVRGQPLLLKPFRIAALTRELAAILHPSHHAAS